MRISRFAPLAAASFIAAAAAPAFGQSVEAFFKGRSVDMIIGAAPGGGYDVYARAIARHMGNHIPGNPNIVPRNMPGAGSNKAAQFVYAVAPKDGSAMGAIFGGVIMEPLLGDAKSLGHDPSKFIYLGSANREVSLCVGRADAAVKSFQDLMQRELLVGASAAGGTSRDFPAALNNVVGTRFNIISGYPGTREITLAVERNEVQGVCGYFLSSLMTQNPDWLESPNMRILVQETAQGDAMLNKRGIPVAADFAKTPEDRQVLELVYAQLVFGRPYILPPGVPADRVRALRAAFDATMKDKAFLADAEKLKIGIDPMPGDEVQAQVAKFFATPAPIVERARNAQNPTKR